MCVCVCVYYINDKNVLWSRSKSMRRLSKSEVLITPAKSHALASLVSFWHVRSSRVHNSGQTCTRSSIHLSHCLYHFSRKSAEKHCQNVKMLNLLYQSIFGRKIHGSQGRRAMACLPPLRHTPPLQVRWSSLGTAQLDEISTGWCPRPNRMGNGGTLFTSTLLNTSWDLSTPLNTS